MNEEQIKDLKGALAKKPSKMPLHRHRDDDYFDRIVITCDEGPLLRASIVPRYKTSGMSGDEWRISARLEVHPNHRDVDGTTPVLVQSFGNMRGLVEHAPHFLWSKARPLLTYGPAALRVYRKEHAIFQEAFASFGDAAMGMSWHIVTANEGRRGVEWERVSDADERTHCQQVGCSDAPVNFYRLKQLQYGNNHSTFMPPKYEWEDRFVWYCARHTTRGDCGLEDADANMELVDGAGVARQNAADESPSVCMGAVAVDIGKEPETADDCDD